MQTRSFLQVIIAQIFIHLFFCSHLTFAIIKSNYLTNYGSEKIAPTQRHTHMHTYKYTNSEKRAIVQMLATFVNKVNSNVVVHKMQTIILRDEIQLKDDVEC